MVRVNALAFIFIVQFLLMFLGIAIFLFIHCRRQTRRAVVSRQEIGRLNDDIRNQKRKSSELLKWKEMFEDLQEKFKQIKNINMKLKGAIETLVPDAEKSKEYKQLISDLELNNNELDSCLESLGSKNDELEKKALTFEHKVEGLNRKLQDYVSKAKYNIAVSENKSLELKVDSLKKQIESQAKEYENLEKNYAWLENEYNALYDNINEES